MNLNFFKKNYEALLSISALIIALTSMLVTFYEARIMRQHQELSVWPNLSFQIRYSNNKKEPFYNLSISNSGLGPAIIKRFYVFHNGKKITAYSDVLMPIGNEFLKTVKNQEMYFGPNNTTTIPVGAIISQNDSILFSGFYTKIFEQQEERAAYLNFLIEKLSANPKLLTFEACYCSLYEKCWIVGNAKKHEEKKNEVENCENIGSESENFTFLYQ